MHRRCWSITGREGTSVTFTTYAWKRAIGRHGRGQPQRELAFPLDAGGGATSDMRQMLLILEEPMDSESQQVSMFSPEDSPARTTQWQASVEDWLATVARSGGSITASSLRDAPTGLSERMFPDSSPATTAGTSEPSSTPSWGSGMAWSGGYLTLNTSEWPKDAGACSLSDILEADPDPKYSLSAKACSGILRRAEGRGKPLPLTLRQVLEEAAGIR